MGQLITFITAFRDFDNYFGPMQRSALFSYELNGIPVIAPDTEPTVARNCSKFSNVTLMQGIRTARDLGYKNSSPILRDMLQKALDLVQTPMVGLINSDVLIPFDFYENCDRIVNKNGDDAFIAVTRRDFTLVSEIKTKSQLKKAFKRESTAYDGASSSDLFIGSKLTFRNIAGTIPEFILGRYAWDNWMHYYAEVTLRHFNGTRAFPILHCRHTHDHILKQEGRPGKDAASSAYNISLLNAMRDTYGSSINLGSWKDLI